MISGEERRICNLEAVVEKLEKDIWEIKDQLEIKDAIISHLLGYYYDAKKHDFVKLHPILKVGQGDFFYFSEYLDSCTTPYICEIIPLGKFIDFFKNYMFLYSGTKELSDLIHTIFVNKYVKHKHSQKFFFREYEIAIIRGILDPYFNPALNLAPER